MGHPGHRKSRGDVYESYERREKPLFFYWSLRSLTKIILITIDVRTDRLIAKTLGSIEVRDVLSYSSCIKEIDNKHGELTRRAHAYVTETFCNDRWYDVLCAFANHRVTREFESDMVESKNMHLQMRASSLILGYVV